MAELRSIGVTSIKLGDILGDGGMGTSLAVLGVTLQDSAILEQGDPTVTDFFSEESDTPIETIEVPGKVTLKWSIVDFSADTLIAVLGGTKDGDPEVWHQPSSTPEIEQSIEIITRKNVMIEITRAKIAAKLAMNLSKNQLAKIDITATILTPTKEAEAAIRITEYEPPA